MTRYRPIPPEAMTPDQLKVREEVIGGPRGRMVPPVEVWIRSPELASHAAKLGGYIRFKSSLPPRLHEREDLLRQDQVGGHRLPDLLTHPQPEHGEHRAEHQRNRKKRRHERLRDEPRRFHFDGSSTGSVKLTSADWPARIVTLWRCSPIRSCQATSWWSPGGTPSTAYVPLSVGIVNHG